MVFSPVWCRKGSAPRLGIFVLPPVIDLTTLWLEEHSEEISLSFCLSHTHIPKLLPIAQSCDPKRFGKTFFCPGQLSKTLEKSNPQFTEKNTTFFLQPCEREEMFWLVAQMPRLFSDSTVYPCIFSFLNRTFLLHS